MSDTGSLVARAREVGLAIPAFNIPYLPMLEPVVAAVVAQDSFALLSTARLEWSKFESQGLAAVMNEFARWSRPGYVRLHLDHVPVIDEDNQQVDYLSILQEAVDLGYQSVMVDGSRLDLAGNIEATSRAVEIAHRAGIPCEAELGAVFGHEAGPLPPYEELFASGRGFTDPQEAARFARETGCDWLSVAVGNVHGAISGALKDRKKVEARLNLERLEELYREAGIPLVLHGGTGIRREYILAAMKRGIAKINIATEIRQAYESALRDTADVAAAQSAVYERTCSVIRDHLRMAGTRRLLCEQEG